FDRQGNFRIFAQTFVTPLRARESAMLFRTSWIHPRHSGVPYERPTMTRTVIGQGVDPDSGDDAAVQG
ncbi:MAG: hypothetical protein ACYSUU_08545, partial [Planctomycetota bacterium]